MASLEQIRSQPAAAQPPGEHEQSRGQTTPGTSAQQPDAIFPDSRATEDAARLQTSLAGLVQLKTDRFELEELLTRVASHALGAVPGGDGASLTLLQEHGQHTIGGTAPFVSDMDHIQHQLGQGPLISALTDRRTVSSASLGDDPRWPRFGGAATRRGVHSALSLLLITEEVVGALTVYAHAKHAFDTDAVTLGETFAAPAAVTVQNAQILDRTQQLVAELQAALATRATIDRAVGILMSRTGSTAQEALHQLRTMSQHEHHKLPVVAQQITDQAVRRAQSHHRDA